MLIQFASPVKNT